MPGTSPHLPSLHNRKKENDGSDHVTDEGAAVAAKRGGGKGKAGEHGSKKGVGQGRWGCGRVQQGPGVCARGQREALMKCETAGDGTNGQAKKEEGCGTRQREGGDVMKTDGERELPDAAKWTMNEMTDAIKLKLGTMTDSTVPGDTTDATRVSQSKQTDAVK